MTNNYFTTIRKNASKKEELAKALHAIREEERVARSNYLDKVESAVRSHPGLTAHQYAIMLSDDTEEQTSIRSSVAMLGYMAEDARRYAKHDPSAYCQHPSIPSLTVEPVTITRHFLEVDKDGNPIGKFSVEETKNTYRVRD